MILPMDFHYALSRYNVTVQVEETEGGYKITILRPGQVPESYQVGAHHLEHGRLTLRFGGRRVQAHVAKAGGVRHVAVGGRNWRLEPPKPIWRRRAVGGGSLQAAMPGKVLDVLVEEGQAVDAGALLVLLEAMKMELRITAPGAGVVRSVYVGAGEIVDRGQKLVDIA